jgi:GTP-binding protein
MRFLAMSLLRSARFHTTVAQLRQLPQEGIPELAFVGRSNAGKSSAINALCLRKRLAFASNTPGRTQALNYFAVGAQPQIDAFLVDMPGYGYAVADKGSRESWGRLSGNYLTKRQILSNVVLVLDIRRGIGPLDEILLNCLRSDQRVLVLASKADKLGRQQRTKAVMDIGVHLKRLRPHAPWQVHAMSATSGVGLVECRGLIEQWLRDAMTPASTAPTH